MIYELRCYTVAPGKMGDLQHRFRDHTLKFFEKYGIKPIAFFTPIISDSNQKFTFILEFKDLAHRESAWTAFMADKDWQQVVSDSNKNGIIVTSVDNKILAPTDFSPLK